MPTTLVGREAVCEAFETGLLDDPTHIAWGSASASFDETDTTLGAEIQRNAINSIDRQSTTIEWTGTLSTAQGNGVNIVEVGLFNDPTTGTMFIRDTLYPVNKTSSFEYDTIMVIRIK